MPSVAAIILAAGESSRLGAFKPLLPWPDEDSPTPLVAYQVEQLRRAGAGPVVVVTGARADEVGAAAEGAGAVIAHNADFAAGKATSVRAGVAAAPTGLPLLIVGVDQPRPAWLYRRLIRAAEAGAPIVIPTCGGRRGHPPLFAPWLRPALLAVQEETFGLRAVLRHYAASIVHLELGTPWALVNLNTPEDLAQARRLGQREGVG
jgi:molybdenum cofactor cytidylyltransferase